MGDLMINDDDRSKKKMMIVVFCCHDKTVRSEKNHICKKKMNDAHFTTFLHVLHPGITDSEQTRLYYTW